MLRHFLAADRPVGVRHRIFHENSSYGGALGGVGVTRALSRPRCSRMRAIVSACVIAAIQRRREPQAVLGTIGPWRHIGVVPLATGAFGSCKSERWWNLN